MSLIGETDKVVGAWERRETALPLDSAYKIALTLGCSVNDLCGWPKGRNKGREFEDDFEAELLRCYRASTPDRQDRILDTARDAAGMSKEMAERHTHEAKQQITADCVEGDTTVFSSNGVANMDEHARLNGERTGGTSTATAASGNPPVANIPEKPRYISAEEACAILSSRGFVDAGTDAALNLLCRVSYQHLSPYIAATSHARGQRSMQQTHDLLMLDRCFQAMAFKYIGIFETQFRAAYSSAMAREHGAFALYEKSLFLRGDNYDSARRSYDAELSRKAKKSPNVKQMLDDSGGMMPVWQSVEFMTLGTLSKFFSNTGDRTVTGAVLDSFGARKREFSSWVRTITAARNIFAHFGHYIVSSQIPSAPLPVYGVSMPNNVPLYLVVLLYRLLDAPDISGDMSMRYAEQLRNDAISVLDPFYRVHGDSLPVPGIPKDWRESLSFWDTQRM